MDQSTNTEYQLSATPGPWRFRAPLSLDNRNPWVVLDEDSHVLALVTRSPREANARLIAAGPDLYYALREFIDDEPCRLDYEGYCQTHHITNPCIVVKAKSAIAKAEGRNP